jgi:hypothetical protein
MGPAVFNGGLSTFLAFILVAFSDSYVFITFFKVSLTLEAAFLLPFLLVAFSNSNVFITFFKVSLTLEAAFLHGLQALHPCLHSRGFQRLICLHHLLQGNSNLRGSFLLPFLLVAFSDSYVFITFFNINLTLEAASIF